MAPSTRTSAGPLPVRSYAIVVPSADVTADMSCSLLLLVFLAGVETGQVDVEAVEAGVETGPRLGAQVCRRHVGLMGDHLGTPVVQVDEGDRGSHAAFDVGLDPHQPVRPADLDVDGPHGVCAAVGIADHGG